MNQRLWRDVARVSGLFCSCLLVAASLTGCKSDTPGGSAPAAATVTISGAPAAKVTAGTRYAFQPTASSSAGDTISFSVQNLPAWATLSMATGELSGTPTAADIGTYANIVISASHDANTAALTPFTITVVNPASGSATVLWTPPTQNLDGTALTNLAGFHIYYGTSANTLTQMVNIGNPATTTYTLANLHQGTWYFALAAYTADQVESDLSEVVSKSI